MGILRIAHGPGRLHERIEQAFQQRRQPGLSLIAVQHNFLTYIVVADSMRFNVADDSVLAAVGWAVKDGLSQIG